MPNSDGTMKNIVLNYRIFKLYDIIKEYESRLTKPNPVLEENYRETQESSQDRFRAYDAYTLFDRDLFRLVIEYLVQHYFCGVSNTRFYHYEDFKKFPGQVHFMIILDACNTSAAIYIEGAEKCFNNLSLNDFPGENIYDISTTVLRYIKVM